LSAGRDAREEQDGRRTRPAPGALELLKWSAVLLGISLLVAAISIPVLRWLGYE